MSQPPSACGIEIFDVFETQVLILCTHRVYSYQGVCSL
jgi:hypothetical protein